MRTLTFCGYISFGHAGLRSLTVYLLNIHIQCNLSIPNLAYTEILFNPNKVFGPKVFYHLLHMKLPCVF